MPDDTPRVVIQDGQLRAIIRPNVTPAKDAGHPYLCCGDCGAFTPKPTLFCARCRRPFDVE